MHKDHHEIKDRITSPIYTLGEDRNRTMILAFAVGLVFMGIGVAMSLPGGGQRFAYAYLMNFCFFISIALGALFFVMSQHLARAGWSVTIRRIAEVLAVCVVPMAILFIPIAIMVGLGWAHPFEWNSPSWISEASDDLKPIYEKKSGYLNTGFFLVRAVVYFILWIGTATFLLRNSLHQDTTKAKGLTSRMQAFSAPLMILFAMSLVFCSFDWEMSLAPMWFSTMFPVYFFAGAVLGGLATITLVALLLQRSGRVTDEITVENYHDMGKLMFGIVVFWGYIAFSQFMLIWYANIPEETFWYNIRFNNPTWRNISIALLFFHLLIPLLGIMSRTVRRSKSFLIGATIYLLAAHWLDHYWIVMPQVNADSYNLTSEFWFPTIELLTFGGFAGLFIGSFCFIAGNRPLVPLGDPRLVEALNYKNA